MDKVFTHVDGKDVYVKRYMDNVIEEKGLKKWFA